MLQALQYDGFKRGEGMGWGSGSSRELPGIGRAGMGGGVRRGEGQGLDRALWLEEEEGERLCMWVEGCL